ncbi:MAG: glycoside hydrolase family 16 protein [Kiritimatiellae bacterium]|jgi:beta-glucanase (GH16 family)|nr:glycoside hydrolase family 16 protein [Kiritimatiellia bacterium]
MSNSYLEMKTRLVQHALTIALLLTAASLSASEISLINSTPGDTISNIIPLGQKEANIKIVDYNDAKAITFTCYKDGGNWPGLQINPTDKIWDLSQYGYIEARITNLSDKTAKLGLKVEDGAGLITDCWNVSYFSVKAGQTATTRVYLDFSKDGTNYKLVPSKINKILLFSSPVTADLSLRVDSLIVTGKPGDIPANYIPHIKPENNTLLSSKREIESKFVIQSKGAYSTIKKKNDSEILSVHATAKEGDNLQGILIRPKKAIWNLTDYSQVNFEIFNPGTSPVTVTCEVNNPAWTKGSALSDAISIAPKTHANIVVPFITDQIWDGSQKAKEQMRTTDRESEKNVDNTINDGQQLLNDWVAGVSIYIKSKNENQSIIVNSIKGGVPEPSVLPSWSGKRPPVPGQWTMSMDENFDGTTLNKELWTPRMHWTGYIPKELHRYSEQNVTVRDGYLSIISEKKRGYIYDTPGFGLPTREYTSGAMTSYDKWSQQYGYFEARMKIPSAPGLWPAFWMMPDRGRSLGDKEKAKTKRVNTSIDGMEFDIMEHLSRLGPYRFNIACHWDGYGKDHKKVGTGRIYIAPDKDGFITCGLLWEPGKATWYYNGKVVAKWTSMRIADAPSFIILCTQMGGWEGFDIDDNQLPAEFIVDYIRVWKNKKWETSN